MKIIFATHNEGKLIEMKNILSDFEVIGAKEAGVFEDVVEDGLTFAENALKKARFMVSKTGEAAIADDSGCCIEALDGAPGIYSARWANGADISDYTLEQIKDVSVGKRQAWFETAAALVFPDGREFVFDGQMHGEMTTEKRGIPLPKLPYDNIFIPNGYDKTCAEMGNDEKNKISHRGKAFLDLRAFLLKELDKS